MCVSVFFLLQSFVTAEDLLKKFIQVSSRTELCEQHVCECLCVFTLSLAIMDVLLFLFQFYRVPRQLGQGVSDEVFKKDFKGKSYSHTHSTFEFH